MTYEYKGREINLHFGMLFMEHFWGQIGDDFTGSDYVATLLYFGNKVHCKLNGGTPVFTSKADAYKFIIDSYEDAAFVELQTKIIDDFQESKEYKSIFTATEEAKKKLIGMKSGDTPLAP